ncbi:hypothetical protein D3C78_880610 [compost metagenome]
MRIQWKECIVLFMIMIGLSACSTKVNPSDPSDSSITEPVSTQRSVGSDAPVQDKVDKIYVNKEIGFEIEFPESWDSDRYEIKEIEDGVEVYYIPMNKEIEEALLFGLDVYGTEAEWNEWWYSEGEDSGAPISLAGISKGNAIIEYGPTEAIYQGRDEAKADASEYDRMSIEISNIIESFKSLNPSATSAVSMNDLSALNVEEALELRDKGSLHITLFLVRAGETAVS